MTARKYDFAKLKAEFMQSEFAHVRSFINSIGMKMNTRIAECTVGWTAEKIAKNRLIYEEETARFFKQKRKLIRKNLNKSIFLTGRGLQKMIDSDDPVAKAIEKYWQIMRTEAGLPIRHVKQTIDVEQFDATAARNEIDKLINNDISKTNTAEPTPSGKALQKPRKKGKAKS